MITSVPHNYYKRADFKADCSFGNVLFTMAGIIGVATKNRYSYGFYPWVNQEFFVNSLPGVGNNVFNDIQNSKNYKGFDIGFRGFDLPDNSKIDGYFGSEKYFEHCKNLIRYYFTMKDLCEPYKDCIIIHYRNYKKDIGNMNLLGKNYYIRALKKLPSKKVVVVTDSVKDAMNMLKEDFIYVSNNPIIDFYLLTKADYLVMANSTFSWWGAWLSGAKTVAPINWYAGSFKDCPTKDLYCAGWELV